MQAAPIIAITIAAIFSGCLGTPEENSQDSTDSDPIYSDASKFDQFFWQSCSSGGTSTASHSQAIAPHSPTGWDTQIDFPPLHFIEFFSCNRIAIGPLERNDVTVIVESVRGPVVPEACRDATSSSRVSKVVLGLWTTDPVLNQWLSENASVSIGLTNAKLFTETGSPAQVRLEWSIDDYANYLDFYGDPSETESTPIPKDSWFWESTSGFHAWIFENERIQQEGGIFSASGSVGRPHNAPNSVNNAWFGGADYQKSNHVITTYLFEDSTCSAS